MGDYLLVRQGCTEWGHSEKRRRKYTTSALEKKNAAFVPLQCGPPYNFGAMKERVRNLTHN
jgi:hypothetical protein